MRKMLEGLGVKVVEVENLPAAACWVQEVGVLLVNPDADRCSWAEAVDLVLLDQVPGQRLAPPSELRP